jgi:hypothetical protein
VVDLDGRLIGVVSHDGGVPIACLALPHWVLVAVTAAQRRRIAKKAARARWRKKDPKSEVAKQQEK